MKKLLVSLSIGLFCNFANANENPLWMRYSAISPDGSKIAFCYKGDIFTVDSKGGKAIALTTHQAYDYLPVWSPDGKKITFSSNRSGNFDVFLVDADGGKPNQLTYYSGTDEPVAFSPDGKEIYFNSSRQIPSESQVFPGFASQLHKISVNGGREIRVMNVMTELANVSKDGNRILFEEITSYENSWRKHHTSSATRNLWMFDIKANSYKQLTQFKGEDRNPVWASNGSDFYYLSEKNGHLNIYKNDVNAANDNNSKVITSFKDHPVRFLSISNNNLLCFSYNGEIYTLTEGGQAQKVSIQINNDENINQKEIKKFGHGASEMALSPNGKELAFVIRGEIFVASVEYGTTKRITNTPSQERSISFSADGRKLLYAGERGGSWNIYETSIKRADEKYFYTSTLLDEKALVETANDEFQPIYSPKSDEIAYLEDRTTLKAYNLASKVSRVLVPAKYFYSYSDGDIAYQWSPDGKWLAFDFIDNNSWISEVGIISADGKGNPINLTQSGYSDYSPKWMMNGEVLIWFNDRYGFRSHGSWGAESDVVALFLTKAAHDKFKLKKEELELLKEGEKKEEKPEEAKKEKEKTAEKDKAKEKEIKPIQIDFAGIENRLEKLTIHSSFLSDAIISNDGEKLYYLSKFEKGFDLWVNKFYEQETKLITKLDQSYGALTMDKEGKNLFVISGGKIMKIDPEKGEVKPVSFNAEMNLDKEAERQYMFDHAWRQMAKKFYVENLHGVNWEMYKNNYQRFLPHINNNYDFAEMLSELLGEVNASHTGSGYNFYNPSSPRTASLGLMYDLNYTGKGLKINEILEVSPLNNNKSKVKKGDILEKIDGVDILENDNIYQHFEQKANKQVLLSFLNPKTGTKWEENVKAISPNDEYDALYKRWVKRNQKITDSLSNGQLAYVHVRGMDSESYREVYNDLLGKYYDKKAVIVDTRYNGGGWLHDDLATLLSGKRYTTFSPRGQENMGGDPQFKWNKPSCVIMNETNYSDAHIFPYTYKTLNIGPLIGMPVAGTGTAVWWERQIDESIYFGIPQVGIKDMNGNLLENQELQPDILVKNDFNEVIKGRDQQLERAIQEMMKK